MYKQYPGIKRTDLDTNNVTTYGNIGDLELRVNVADYEKDEHINWDPLHYHKTSTVFVVVTSGTLVLEIEGEIVGITKDKMIQIDPLTKYKVVGVKNAPTKYIFIGTKNLEGDRVVVEEN